MDKTTEISQVPLNKISIVIKKMYKLLKSTHKKKITKQKLSHVFMAEMNWAYLHEIQLYRNKSIPVQFIRQTRTVDETIATDDTMEPRYNECDLLTKGIRIDKNITAGVQQCQRFNRTELFYCILSGLYCGNTNTKKYALFNIFKSPF